MNLQFIKELKTVTWYFSPQNTCTNTNCYNCVCNQCKELWQRKALGLKFHVNAWVVTTRGNLLCAAVTLSIRVWAEA